MENRIVNLTLTVKQAEEAIEYWLTNAILKNSQKVKEVTYVHRDETFTIAFQEQEI
jgi:uncharacterized protein YkuJ